MTTLHRWKPMIAAIPEHPAESARRRRRTFDRALLAVGVVVMLAGCGKQLIDSHGEYDQGKAVVNADLAAAQKADAAIPPKIEIVWDAVPATQRTPDVTQAKAGALDDVKTIKDALDDVVKTGLPHFDHADAGTKQRDDRIVDLQAQLKSKDNKIFAAEAALAIFAVGLGVVMAIRGDVLQGGAIVAGAVVVMVLCEGVIKLGHAFGMIGLGAVIAGGVAVLIYKLHKSHVNLAQVNSYAKAIGVDAVNLSEEGWQAVVDKGRTIFSPATRAAVGKLDAANEKAKGNALAAAAMVAA